MKIIISHDVDHLFREDHYFDLIYPKLWIRSTLDLLRKKCTLKEYKFRMKSPFEKTRHRIYDVINYDKENGVPSTFFFGMKKGLGMSYGCEKAIEVIKRVDSFGFDVGVHGISFDNMDEIQLEHDMFESIVNRKDFGIRMHYVRFSDNTLKYLDDAGYLFDTTEYDKSNLKACLKDVYKEGNIWEFPLCVMDGYLPSSLEDKKKETIHLIQEAERQNIKYFTILFHDSYFTDGYYAEKEWYAWTIKFLKSEGYEFISYKDAIKELNSLT